MVYTEETYIIQGVWVEFILDEIIDDLREAVFCSVMHGGVSILKQKNMGDY